MVSWSSSCVFIFKTFFFFAPCLLQCMWKGCKMFRSRFILSFHLLTILLYIHPSFFLSVLLPLQPSKWLLFMLLLLFTVELQFSCFDDWVLHFVHAWNFSFCKFSWKFSFFEISWANLSSNIPIFNFRCLS